ncbi:MAG: DsbE family thiol:disulfide interchange protein [Alphaproteobacteria bacterium]|nr:DsbE family thiol:disulfide interchange protein [Alphaproteobacteria bacterium]
MPLTSFIFGKYRLIIFIPLIVIIALMLAFSVGLFRTERGLPSALIGQKIPEFTAQTLEGDAISDEDLLGDEVMIINFFASWCVPCLAEHPILRTLQETHNLTIHGIAWRDNALATQQWLDKYGRVFEHVIIDEQQNIGLDFGVYGIPETFIVDKYGIIRYRWAGVLTEQLLKDEILPLISEYQ